MAEKLQFNRVSRDRFIELNEILMDPEAETKYTEEELDKIAAEQFLYMKKFAEAGFFLAEALDDMFTSVTRKDMNEAKKLVIDILKTI
jgi:hypothetical protein